MIANNYIYTSRLQSQMYWGADWYFTYGFLPIHVEPDFETKLPRIRIEDPMGLTQNLTGSVDAWPTPSDT